MTKVPMGDRVNHFMVDDLDDPEGTIVTSAFMIVKRVRPDMDRPQLAFVANDGLTFDEQIGLLRDVLLKVEHDSLAAWEDE